MDSLTQMVLGAAVGEAAMGKKLGNRAALWGGIAGTIPDLDVMANFFMTPLDALVFHRGITHSVVFCLLAALLMGWLVPKMYKNPYHKFVGGGLWTILVVLLCLGIMNISSFSLASVFISLPILVFTGWLIYKRYSSPSYHTNPEASIRDWQWLFWWSFITHPILDCFTTYGTQILLPFSDHRVAFNNIAVADPIYTILLIIFLLWALAKGNQFPARQKLNNLGLWLSSAYMLFTLINKQYINHIFKETLADQNIEYSRYMTTPTILNNVLWSGIAESDSSYYFGQYSWFDTKNRFKIQEIAKNHSLIQENFDKDNTLQTLAWFSNDFYSVKRPNNDTLYWYDLRFGSFRLTPESKDEFVFKFDLVRSAEGYIMQKQTDGPRNRDTGAIFNALWTRIKGI